MTSMWTYPGLRPTGPDDRTRVQERPLATVRMTVCGEPPVAMIWNPDLAPTLHPDKVRRWFNGGGVGGAGGSTGDWDEDQVAEFVTSLCIVHHGPSLDAAGHRWRLREDCGEFFQYLRTVKLRYDREVCLHWFALKFVQTRAQAKRWVTPANLEAMFDAAVEALEAKAAPPVLKPHPDPPWDSSPEAFARARGEYPAEPPAALPDEAPAPAPA